jgi:hypothetical protein
MKTAVLPAAWAAVCLLAPTFARSQLSYACRQLDVPGATSTQTWQLNNSGQLAAGSSLGAYIYSDGVWSPLPQPPAASGYTQADLGALGINDLGVVTGPARRPGDTSGQGFFLVGSTYSFFSYLPDVWPFTEPRQIANNGVVTGWAYNADSSRGEAFVLNTASVPEYPPGFTEVVPTLADGTPSYRAIPGAMNSTGQFVGSADFAGRPRFGFLYDPDWMAHGAAQPVSLFQVAGRYTAARGLNDRGDIVGFTRPVGSPRDVGYLLANGGQQLITCPELDAGGGIYLESINETRVISGIVVDASGTNHGMIAYPDVVLPIATVDGRFVFDTDVLTATPIFLGASALPVGYRYTVGADNPLFASITLPIGIGDNIYTLIVDGHAFTISAGVKFDFTLNGYPQGVAVFEVLGIEPAAPTPSDPVPFITEVAFATSGRFTGTMTSMTISDEIADLLAVTTGVGPGKGFAAKVSAAMAAYTAGDLVTACSAISDLLAQVAAQSGKHVTASRAAALTAEATTIANAIGCP